MDNAEKLNRVQMTIKDGQCRETEQGTKDNKRWTMQRN
jgi:hypothetical protein